MGRAQNTHHDPFLAVFGSRRGVERELTTQDFLEEIGFITPFVRSSPETGMSFTFTPTRWPYTYAYDYVRSVCSMSRGDVAAALRTYVDGDEKAKEWICIELASLYCKQLGIDIPADLLTVVS